MPETDIVIRLAGTAGVARKLEAFKKKMAKEVEKKAKEVEGR